jgi:hypothetical protein
MAVDAAADVAADGVDMEEVIGGSRGRTSVA